MRFDEHGAISSSKPTFSSRLGVLGRVSVVNRLLRVLEGIVLLLDGLHSRCLVLDGSIDHVITQLVRVDCIDSSIILTIVFQN